MTFRTTTEASLADLWQEMLQPQGLGRQSEFFALGGTSLQATRLIARVQDAFQVELPLSVLASGLTIERMAALIDEQKAAALQRAGEDREQGEIGSRGKDPSP